MSDIEELKARSLILVEAMGSFPYNHRRIDTRITELRK